MKAVLTSLNTAFLPMGDFRFEYEYEIEYKNDFSILIGGLHIPISSHELPSLPKHQHVEQGL